jgi:hypothetical protein
MSSDLKTGREPAARLWPADVGELLGQVEGQLEAEGPGKALESLDRARAAGPWVVNARGVCLMRMGEHQRALELFRALVQDGAGVRDDAPTVFKANYATAQLLTGNLTGCVVTLGQARDEAHPSVRRLREALGRWRRGLPFWQRVGSFLGFDPGAPVELGFPPGDL